jgi:ribosomal protein L15E
VSYESVNPFAVVDTESSPPRVVTRYTRLSQAEWFLGYLAEHGGTVTRAKVERGGYSIDGPDEGRP